MKLSSPQRSGNGSRAEDPPPAADEDELGQVRRLFLSAAWISPPPRTIKLLEAKAVDTKTWEAASALARRVNQEPLFLQFVKKYGPIANLPPEIRNDLENQTRFHAFRWAEICESVKGLLESFEKKGIHPVLLKGIALAGESYDPPHLRPMRDVDVLVRNGEIDAARAAAEESGFAPDCERHPSEKYEGHHHLAPLFHRETGICLEIHHHVLKLPKSFQGFPPAEEFWCTLRGSRLFSGRASVLEPSLAILNTCVHITHGDSIGRRAQNIIDLARTVEMQGRQINWNRLEDYAAQPDVARALAVPLSYLAREGLATAPDSVLACISERSGLKPWETELLMGLIDRYRIGAPPAWSLVSGRISNILWRQALRRGSVLLRSLTAVWEVICGKIAYIVSKD